MLGWLWLLLLGLLFDEACEWFPIVSLAVVAVAVAVLIFIWVMVSFSMGILFALLSFVDVLVMVVEDDGKTVVVVVAAWGSIWSLP